MGSRVRLEGAQEEEQAMGGDVVQWEDRKVRVYNMRDVKEDNPNNTLKWCQEAWVGENSEEASHFNR